MILGPAPSLYSGSQVKLSDERTCVSLKPIVHPHLDSAVFSTTFRSFVRGYRQICPEIPYILGGQDDPDCPETRGNALRPLVCQVLIRCVSLIFIGKANQQDVISGPTVLSQERSQTKYVDFGEIVELVARI